MKKDTGANKFFESSDEEMKKLTILKEGLEDINLFLMEVEQLSKKLSDDNLPDKERNILNYKLKSIESLMDNLNKTISQVIPLNALEKNKLS